MSRAYLFLLLLLPLSACDGTTPIAAPTGKQLPAQPVAREAVAAEARIACAIAPSATFAPTCIFERSTDAAGPVLTIRHPDGGFRRLRITSDGRGVIAADGADLARVKIIGANQIEVAIAGDQYRLPATIGDAGQNK